MEQLKAIIHKQNIVIEKEPTAERSRSTENKSAANWDSQKAEGWGMEMVIDAGKIIKSAWNSWTIVGEVVGFEHDDKWWPKQVKHEYEWDNSISDVPRAKREGGERGW